MEYLSVKEFAEAAGVTVQAIYKRVKTDLAPFTKDENGVKLVNKEALELFKVTQSIKQSNREQELLERIKELEGLVDTLTQEKISLLEKSAEDKEKLWQFAEKLAQLQENSQVLLAQHNQVVLSLKQPNSTEENDLTKVEKVELNSNKQGLFAWLTKRRNNP